MRRKFFPYKILCPICRKYFNPTNNKMTKCDNCAKNRKYMRTWRRMRGDHKQTIEAE